MEERKLLFTGERISSQDLTNGRNVVKVTPGGTKILAVIEDGKFTHYEAEDDAGNQRPLSIVRVTAQAPSEEKAALFALQDDLCWICVDDGVGSPLCYQDECDFVEAYLHYLEAT